MIHDLIMAAAGGKDVPVIASVSAVKQEDGTDLTIITPPSGVVAGDLLLAFGFSEKNAGAWILPSGWTLIVDDTVLPDAMAAYKIATGSDSYAFAHSNSSRHAVVAMRITGGAYESVSTVKTEPRAGSVTAASLTTSTPPALAFSAFGCTPSAITFATPSGWTSAVSYNAFAPSFQIFYKTPISSSSGDAIVDPSGTSGTSGAFQVLIKPA